MNTTIAGITISSVNMEDRKNLGIKAGDTVRVHQKIQDKGKTRIQVFEGLVLARKHGAEAGATFTVRKVVDGIGVEKIFPLYSPQIDKIEIMRRSTVRKAKLYYIREKVAREVKRQMRRMRLMNVSSESEMEVKAENDRKAAEEAAKKAEVERLEAEAKAAEEARIAAEEAAKAPVEVAEEVAPTEEKEEEVVK
jgi:large subunit ribosomal protein L19